MTEAGRGKVGQDNSGGDVPSGIGQRMRDQCNGETANGVRWWNKKTLTVVFIDRGLSIASAPCWGPGAAGPFARGPKTLCERRLVAGVMERVENQRFGVLASRLATPVVLVCILDVSPAARRGIVVTC